MATVARSRPAAAAATWSATRTLDAETSVNKELGIEFRRDGWVAGLTYFRNDYKNKIVAPLDVMGQTGTGNNILQWSNAKKAVVEGLEGNLLVPCTRT